MSREMLDRDDKPDQLAQKKENKIFRSLLDDCEDSLYFSGKKPEVKMPGDEQPFLDELSNIFQVDEAANLTNVNLNDDPGPQIRD